MAQRGSSVFGDGTSKSFRGSRKRVQRIRLRDHADWRVVLVGLGLLILLMAAAAMMGSRAARFH
jgi:hypothetical protein